MTTVVHIDSSFLCGSGPRHRWLRALEELSKNGVVKIKLAWVAKEETISGKARAVEQALIDRKLLHRLNWLPSLADHIRHVRSSAEKSIRDEFEALVAKLQIEVVSPTGEQVEASMRHYFYGSGPVAPARNREDIPDALIFESMLAARGPDRNVAIVNDKKFLEALSSAGFEILVGEKSLRVPSGITAHRDFNDALGLEAGESLRRRLTAEFASWDDVELAQTLRDQILGEEIAHPALGTLSRYGPSGTISEVTDTVEFAVDFAQTKVLSEHIAEAPFAAKLGCVVNVFWDSAQTYLDEDALEEVQHFDASAGEADFWTWVRMTGTAVFTEASDQAQAECTFELEKIAADE